MTRQVLYVAHPVAPTEEEIGGVPYERIDPGRNEYESDVHFLIPDSERVALAVRANLDRAMRWLSWLRRSFPETTFIAPWISGILAGEDDADPAQREAGQVDCCAVVERCDGIVLCGGRISSGMRREMEHGIDVHRLGMEYAMRAARRTARSAAVWISSAVNQLCGTFDVYDLTSVTDSVRDDGEWIGGGQACPEPWVKWAEYFLNGPAPRSEVDADAHGGKYLEPFIRGNR